MPRHRFSLRQLLISTAVVCAGLALISLACRPLNLPLDPAYDTLADWIPFLRLFALLAGSIMIPLGSLPLVSRRRVGEVALPILGGALVAIVLLQVAFAAFRRLPILQEHWTTLWYAARHPLVIAASITLGGLTGLSLAACRRSRVGGCQTDASSPPTHTP